MKLSLIIPVLNEHDNLEDLLDGLMEIRAMGHEIIVVDGGSGDGSLNMVRNRADKCFLHDRGRAVQMNAGASCATGDILLFLHADTRVPRHFHDTVITACGSGQIEWGFFQVRLAGGHWLFRLIETGMNLRSQLTAIATGDQCLFMTRSLFNESGGYPDIPLMEDITLCRRLKAFSRPAIINRPVVTSSRRWQQRGIVRTIAGMWCLRLAYFLGVSPARLARMYYG